jgi:hypothetical protein
MNEELKASLRAADIDLDAIRAKYSTTSAAAPASKGSLEKVESSNPGVSAGFGEPRLAFFLTAVMMVDGGVME